MEDLNYPDFAGHKKRHQQLVSDLSNKLVLLKLNRMPAEEVEDFLTDWFVNHVTREDRKIGEFLQQN